MELAALRRSRVVEAVEGLFKNNDPNQVTKSRTLKKLNFEQLKQLQDWPLIVKRKVQNMIMQKRQNKNEPSSSNSSSSDDHKPAMGASEWDLTKDV